MRMRQVVVHTVAVLAALGWTAAAARAAEGPPYRLAVKRDKALGSTPGTLTFGADTLEFKPRQGNDGRSWRYDDVRQLQIWSARRIDVLTYEDQGWLKFGADRTYKFALSDGEVFPELMAFLLRRIERPLVLGVIPPACCETPLKVSVKHERQGKGSEGVLAVQHGALIYDTPREGEARYWRFADLESVLPLDRYRLQVTAREGGGLRLFVFQLKTEPPDGFYDAVWAGVNGRPC